MFQYPTKQTPDPDAAASGNHGIPDEEPTGAKIDPAVVKASSDKAAKEAEAEKKAEEAAAKEAAPKEAEKK